MRGPDALPALVACLNGSPPHPLDWTAVLALANRSLVTATLARSLDGLEGVPEEVRSFLAAVRARNHERNRRLRAQLREAAAELGAAGITPVVLKGTAVLATADADDASDRMLSDLDLLVRPEDFDRSVERLSAVGYGLYRQPAAAGAPAVLARNCDVGMVDLHRVVKGGRIAFGYDRLARDAARADLGAVSVMVPSATCQAAHLFVHDQLKGRDHVRGLIDLRHLLDLRRLCAGPDGIDWHALAAALPDRHARRALASHLLTARRLLQVEVPDELCSGVCARIHYRRRLLQARWPELTGTLTLLAILSDPSSLAAGRRLRRAAVDARSRGWRCAVRAMVADARRLLRGRIWGKA